MPRYNESIATTPDEITAFAESLRTIAMTFDQQAETIRKNGLSTLSVPKWDTAKGGLTSLASFAAGIQDAIVKAKVMDNVKDILSRRESKEVTDEKPVNGSKKKVKRDDKPK